MTRDPITDPEILADLRRRADSERDTTRARPVGWTSPAIVEHWPCSGCAAMVGMTRDAIDLHAMFNAQLERRRDKPLPKRGQCEACKRAEEERLAAQRRPHEQTEMPVVSTSAAARELAERTNRRRAR